MWFDVSEVSTASVFGEVSKLKKLRARSEHPAVRNKLYLLSDSLEDE